MDQRRFQHEVIYSNGFRHLHPADLVQLRNGELLMMTSEATEHISNDGDVVMLRSKDGGRTWGEKQVIAAIKDVDEREGCGIQLRDGTIVMGIFFNNLYGEDGSYTYVAAEQDETSRAGKALSRGLCDHFQGQRAYLVRAILH